MLTAKVLTLFRLAPTVQVVVLVRAASLEPPVALLALAANLELPVALLVHAASPALAVALLVHAASLELPVALSFHASSTALQVALLANTASMALPAAMLQGLTRSSLGPSGNWEKITPTYVVVAGGRERGDEQCHGILGGCVCACGEEGTLWLDP